MYTVSYTHLDVYKRQGFNAAQIGDGNITNIVIKSRYALLDMKCDKLEIRLKQFLKKLVKVVLDEINGNNGTGYTLNDVDIRFTRQIMTNACLLYTSIKKGLYPFAEDCGDGVRPNIKIYTDRFIAVSYTHLDVYKRQVVRITW